MNGQGHPEDGIEGAAPRRDRARAWRARRLGGIRGGALLSVAILVAIVVLAGLARTSAGRQLTASLGIRNGREPYTTLAFQKAGTLGSAGVYYHIAQIHDRFAFAITNSEHRALHYTWTVDFDPAGRVYRGSVFLRSGESRTVTPYVLFPCDADVPVKQRHLHNVSVRVSLQPTHEAIDFLQECDD